MINDYKTFLIKYAEIGIKGNNRYIFEDALVKQIKLALDRLDGTYRVYKTWGRIYAEVEDYAGSDAEQVIEALKKVFGISGICPCLKLDDHGFGDLKERVVDFMGRTYPDRNITFKVHAKRSRKNYPFDSMEINAMLGEALIETYPEMKVDVHKPQVMLCVEIREDIYVYSEEIPGAFGMPSGTAGKAMLLLSGGIDSPVAGYCVAKRGVSLEAVYFHAPPYTSERAKQKVVDLAKIVASYAGPIKLHVINFTALQLHIYDKCPHDELTIIMRRYMMKIAQELAEASGCIGLVTGESIGQVASQTMQSMYVTNEVCRLPVYRPLVGFDKQEIVERALKIGTYETSILPFEDCCTIFVAKHPVTKPNLGIIKRHEGNMGEEGERLYRECIDTAETLVIS